MIESELVRLNHVLNRHEALLNILASAVVEASEKASIITAIAKKAGFSSLTINFVGTVSQAGRAGELPVMVDRFVRMCARARGSLRAEAASAKPMDDKQKNRLTSTLKQVLGQDVILETRVEPALLGGLMVKIGSRMFDNSLKTKLEGLKMAMKES